ncbi:LysR family transcriptional regulator [Saccharothrix sp. 6-C]|uniref:LysR substrate-binding domain-containing protein n=1 Tax=Saccharothrix sp. 6-C TaxID=2781735 RepID=UPI00191757A0|nr:LysR substrate-binding domain-containing protein [Saccharothrix sp. 6-C]QQQ79539.1 LysR family transcriptional regulator [Saccharothrix sp. 6-C]
MVRLGYHGSRTPTERVVRAAGRSPDEVDLVVYDIADPFAALRAGEVDLMVVKFRIDEPDLVLGPTLVSDGRAAVLAAGHPLAARPSLSVEDLVDEELFAAPGRLPGYVWDQVVPPVTPSGRPLRRVHRVLTVAEMMRLVAGSSAVHLSVVSLADLAPPEVAVVPVSDLSPAPVALAWRATGTPAEALAFAADAAGQAGTVPTASTAPSQA